MKGDLHIHTRCSDGGKTVNEILEIAINNHCDFISITDHDTIEAYNNIDENLSEKIKIIKGIEIDVIDKGKKYHFLCYNFNEKSKLFAKYLDDVKEHEKESFLNNIQTLEDKYNINFDKKITEDFISKNFYLDLTRMNSLLVLNGFSKDEREAYYSYSNILPKHDRYKISFERLNEIANDSKAIIVLAHPNKYADNMDERLAIIDNFRSRGLKAFEAYSNKNTLEEEKMYLEYAKTNNMLVSAGSDYHSKFGADEKREIGKILNRDIDLKLITIKLFE